MERCREVHRIRRVYKNPLRAALRRICELPETHCPSHVKLIANWCLATDKGVPPRLQVEKIRAELRGLKFSEEMVRPIAYCSGTGECVRDWYQAVDDIRLHYDGKYLSELGKRFGLSNPP